MIATLPRRGGAPDQPPNEVRRGGWLPSANGLRATACVLVFIHHASFLSGATFESGLGALFARFDVGVSIFFALSGFLLARPYLAAILDGTALPDIRSFYRRRLLRIIPAYWVALTAAYVWLRPESATQAGPGDAALHYTFLQIYPADTFTKGISATWTLAVEMSFYAVLPLLALLAARLLRNQAGPSRRAVLLLLAMAAAAAFGLGWRALVFGADWPLQVAGWLPGTIVHFAVGIAIAVLAVWAERREVARPLTDALGRHDLLWWVLAGAVLFFSSNQLGLARGLDHASWNREVFLELSRAMVAGFLLLPVAFGPQDRGLVRRFLQAWPVAALGVASYGFFLWHVPLIESCIEWTGRNMFLDWSKPGMGVFSADVLEPVALAFALSIVAGAVSWFVLEKPLLTWRRRTAPADEPPVVEQAAP